MLSMEIRSMEPSRHRLKVKIVAIVDITFCVLSILGALALFLRAYFFSAVAEEAAADTGDFEIISNTSTLLSAIWFIVLVEVVVVMVKIVAAVKLLQSSQVERDPKDSYNLCKFWRNVNGGYLIVLVVYLIMLSGHHTFFKDIGVILIVLVYCAALVLVHLYMRDLLTFEFIPNSEPIMMTENNIVITRVVTNTSYDLDEEQEFAFQSAPMPSANPQSHFTPSPVNPISAHWTWAAEQ